MIRLEELGLFGLFVVAYNQLFPAGYGFFFALFLVPDLSFLVFVISKTAGAIAYNIFHHRGLLSLLVLAGYFLQADILLKTGLIFLAHATFDRLAGYGLKYLDSFDHTHLGWIGKSRHLNEN